MVVGNSNLQEATTIMGYVYIHRVVTALAPSRIILNIRMTVYKGDGCESSTVNVPSMATLTDSGIRTVATEEPGQVSQSFLD